MPCEGRVDCRFSLLCRWVSVNVLELLSMSNHASLTGNDNCMCALQLWTLSLSWGQYETWELLGIVFNFYISQSTTIPPKSFVKFPSTEKVMSLTQTSGIAPAFLSETAPASVSVSANHGIVLLSLGYVVGLPWFGMAQWLPLRSWQLSLISGILGK